MYDDLKGGVTAESLPQENFFLREKTITIKLRNDLSDIIDILQVAIQKRVEFFN